MIQIYEGMSYRCVIYLLLDNISWEMFKLFIATLCVTYALSALTLQKVVVQSPEALCLDGTSPAYYFVRGDPNKIIVSFEGGGWCGSWVGLPQTLEDCYQRSKTTLGSSSTYPNSFSLGDGILSDNALNPFRNWTMVHLKYCTGTGHQGYSKDPIKYKDTNLYIKGHNVTIALLDALNKNFGLFQKGKEIIVTGQSAGGLATYLWSNYIAEKAEESYVWSLPDCGLFLDSLNFQNKLPTYRMQFQNFMKLSNQEVDPPNKECVISHRGEEWKCMFAEYNHVYITVPLFPIQSLYDSWSIPNILGISCENGGSLAKCNDAQLKYIDEYHKNTSVVLEKVLTTTENGCWGAACSNHVYSFGGAFYNEYFRVPANSGNSISSSIVNWMTKSWKNNGHLDVVSWPENKPCSGVKLISEQ